MKGNLRFKIGVNDKDCEILCDWRPLKETKGRWQNMVDFSPIMLCNAVDSDTFEV